MNERIRELYRQANEQAHQQACEKNKTLRPQNNTVWNEFVPLFAELIVQECAKELREAEQEADRAYKAKEVKERNTFDGYDFADMLEERFGVES